MKELVGDMNAGKVQLLLILGGNPVFDAPADSGLRLEPCARCRCSVHHGMYAERDFRCMRTGTSTRTHFLEEWSDARAINGMVSIVQPLIAPLYGGRSAHEVLAVF